MQKGRIPGSPLPPIVEDIDIEEYAKYQTVKQIAAKFKGHGLGRLVEAILRAQGYVTRLSPAGPDGGMDILAAAGPLGFDKPRVCIQVKSSSSPVDVKIIRELQGMMSKVRAEQGLLVSWGGFTSAAIQESKDAFFSIRLWDKGALLEEIFRYYVLTVTTSCTDFQPRHRSQTFFDNRVATYCSIMNTTQFKEVFMKKKLQPERAAAVQRVKIYRGKERSQVLEGITTVF